MWLSDKYGRNVMWHEISRLGWWHCPKQRAKTGQPLCYIQTIQDCNKTDSYHIFDTKKSDNRSYRNQWKYWNRFANKFQTLIWTVAAARSNWGVDGDWQSADGNALKLEEYPYCWTLNSKLQTWWWQCFEIGGMSVRAAAEHWVQSSKHLTSGIWGLLLWMDNGDWQFCAIAGMSLLFHGFQLLPQITS